MTRALLLLLLLPTTLPAQAVEYEISFPNLVHHEAEISITFTGVPSQPLEVRMSRSSPGRYALHEFAKNVYSVEATDGSGRPLRVTRPNAHQWDVHGSRRHRDASATCCTATGRTGPTRRSTTRTPT
jgi:predicted metalloprotease with PDZ domain